MKAILFIGLILLSGCVSTTDLQEQLGEKQKTIDLKDKTIGELEETITIYESAETKRQTRTLLDQQRNKELYKDTQELMFNLWQTSIFCGDYALCNNNCEYEDYSRQEYHVLCEQYYYSITEQEYDEIDLRLQEVLE